MDVDLVFLKPYMASFCDILRKSGDKQYQQSDNLRTSQFYADLCEKYSRLQASRV